MSMLRTRLVLMCVPLVFSGGALASSPASVLAAPTVPAHQAETPEAAAKLSGAFSVLHAVEQTATDFSKLAEKRAKSDLVKNYANATVTANSKADEKLLRVAKQAGINVEPLDPKTEDGKSLLDRMNAEAVMLGSLEGDAWDKEYMVLVTNTQQSVLRMLKVHRAVAKDKEVRQYLDDTIKTVQKRLDTSQEVMAKIYGDKV